MLNAQKLQRITRRFMSCATLLVVAAVCRGQAPGGVTANLAAWYKADLNVVGDPVSAWNTSGGSATGFQLNQGNAAYRPGLTSGDVNYKRYNYNPRVSFSAANLTRLENGSTSPDLYGTAGSVFLVSDHNTTYATALSYSTGLSTKRIQMKPTFRIQTSTGSSGYTADFGMPTEYSVNSAALFAVSGLGVNAAHRLNSVSLACSICGNTTFNPNITTGLRVGRNAAGGGSEYLTGGLGEIVIYSNSLNALQIRRIESYLAVKYGITRGGNTGVGAAFNYVSANNTTIWDKPLNAGYNNDIAGIGRDDASALVQKQSISVNNGEPVSIGLVSIDASNAANGHSFDANTSFLMWGNNGLSLQTEISDPNCFIDLPPGIEARIQRVWKSQATNFSQLVTVGFEAYMLVGYTPLGNLRLLVDDDGTNWTNAMVISGAVMDGARIEFAGVTLDAERPFFTLATIHYNNTPLPIEWLHFSAQPAGPDAVQLDWATASETGNAWFDVERSRGGATFEGLARIPGAGHSMSPILYRYMDLGPLPGTNYYRLRQVDLYGMATYSEVRAVTTDMHPGLRVFPNPANDVLYIVGADPEEGTTVQVFTAAGAHVPLPDVVLHEGLLNVSTLPRGLYLLRIGDRVARFVKE